MTMRQLSTSFGVIMLHRQEWQINLLIVRDVQITRVRL